jgi:phosphatidylinositol alpha-mannosyltransferase
MRDRTLGNRNPALRVALLNPTFWPEVRRGSERMIRDLATGLIARGHRPRLIVGSPSHPGLAVEDGLPILRTRRGGNRLASWAGYHEQLGHAPFQYVALRRGSDQLAHAFYVSDANAAVRWARRTGRPSIFSVMGIARPDQIQGRRGRRRMWRDALGGSDAVVALSAAAADPLRQLGANPKVIHPGIELDAFRPVAERSPEPTVLCASDAADQRKRVEMLVEAQAEVRRAVPEARLLVSHPSDPDLARRLSGSPLVELVNLDNREELTRRYSSAWVTALPAWGEAFGLVVLESLACGTPAVGAKDGGVPEILGGEPVGRLFGGDAVSLAAAILECFELAQKPETRDRCRARAERFSIDGCVDRHLTLYEGLVAGQ